MDCFRLPLMLLSNAFELQQFGLNLRARWREATISSSPVFATRGLAYSLRIIHPQGSLQYIAVAVPTGVAASLAKFVFGL